MGGALTRAEILTGFAVKPRLPPAPPPGLGAALGPPGLSRRSRTSARAGPARHVPGEAGAPPAVPAAPRPARAAPGRDPGVSLQGRPLPPGGPGPAQAGSAGSGLSPVGWGSSAAASLRPRAALLAPPGPADRRHSPTEGGPGSAALMLSRPLPAALGPLPARTMTNCV